ncbi:60S ribosomal protein L23A, partial [Massospora cicadina]
PKKESPEKKATEAQKRIQKGIKAKGVKKIRTSATFRRPKTLKLARKPLYPRISYSKESTFDHYAIIKKPLNTEHAMKKIENHNTLVFICDLRATKPQIKRAIKKLYDVDALKVNTLITPRGFKKAYIRLTPDHEALDVANR